MRLPAEDIAAAHETLGAEEEMAPALTVATASEALHRRHISRDSVRKMLAFSVPPGYRRTAPVKRPKLDGFTGIIDGWLEGDREVHRKQRHTAKRVF